MRILLLPIISGLLSTIIAAGQPVMSYDHRPALFIENKGQITDQHGSTNQEVRFLYHEEWLNVLLKKGGFSYELFYYGNEETADGNEWDGKNNTDGGYRKLYSHRIDVAFEGSNDVNPVPMGDPETYYNFYRAPVSRHQYTYVPAYTRLFYPNLYEGIDLIWYAPTDLNGKHLRYEFIVHPGADMQQIRWRYSGARQVYLDEAGNQVVTTAYGSIRESQPLCYVEGQQHPLVSDFVLHGTLKTIRPVSYNRNKYMIIDPNIIWGTFYGGEKNEEISEVAVGNDQRPVIDGQTISFQNIASSGAWQTDFGGGVHDFFIAKFKEDGKLYWGTYFGGTDKEDCYGMDVDAQNNIILVGNTESAGLATAGAYKDSIIGLDGDVLLAKFTSSGQLIWSTYYGGSEHENARNMVADLDGYLYMAGVTGSPDGIATPGAYQETYKGNDDSWIAKFTPQGFPVWATYHGDSGVDRAHVVALDYAGHVYMGATTSSTVNIATPGAHQTVFAGGVKDAYLTKFDTSGQVIWSTYYGGPLDDRARGVDVDTLGNVYLSGFGNSDSMIATPGSHQPKWSEGPGGDTTDDGYLVKFTAAGERIWGTYYGGPKTESLWGATIDRNRDVVYICGAAGSESKIAYGNAMQSKLAGSSDGFIARFRASGVIDWGTYWGGPSGDQFEDMVTDQNEFIYACGKATSNDILITSNTYQQFFFGGSSDAILLKFYAGPNCYDKYEPNESLAASKLLTPSFTTDTNLYGYNGGIAKSDDADWYSFNVESSFPHNMVLLSDLVANYDLNLYDALGVLIYQSSHAGDTPDTIAVNNMASGIYYLEIAHGSNAFDSLNCYRLQLFRSDVPFPETGVPTELPQQPAAVYLKVYPNPANDFIQVEIPENAGSAGVVIYDLLHRPVYKKPFSSTGSTRMMELPLTELPPGPYTILVVAGAKNYAASFIRQ